MILSSKLVGRTSNWCCINSSRMHFILVNSMISLAQHFNHTLRWRETKRKHQQNFIPHAVHTVAQFSSLSNTTASWTLPPLFHSKPAVWSKTLLRDVHLTALGRAVFWQHEADSFTYNTMAVRIIAQHALLRSVVDIAVPVQV